MVRMLGKELDDVIGDKINSLDEKMAAPHRRIEDFDREKLFARLVFLIIKFNAQSSLCGCGSFGLRSQRFDFGKDFSTLLMFSFSTGATAFWTIYLTM